MELPNQPGPFSRLARWTAHVVGRPIAFVLAVAVIVIWAATGLLFHFSATWQLVIITGTTIVTFLMVFLIQHTQNADSVALQVKIDEPIRATYEAHNALLDLEELTPEELDAVRSRYLSLAREAREDLRKGIRDTGSPDLE